MHVSGVLCELRPVTIPGTVSGGLRGSVQIFIKDGARAPKCPIPIRKGPALPMNPGLPSALTLYSIITGASSVMRGLVYKSSTCRIRGETVEE
jgi:hypothetical protein